ncbi:nuclear transport factor 2 family protein [Flavobacteriaceae bacterium]|nr:nuclear transport factor 2 family protein [Flavobacteriaceae bacterium]|tara:strand:+ start:58 stop:678 length:621 start_codon:yes stop_codon:yes gene_type:complete
MNQIKLFLVFVFILITTVSGQQLDLNNIKIDDVKNLLGNVLGNKEKNKANWSGIVGDPNFNVADRIAINDVIDAYGIYWDTNNLDGYLSLFTDDAIGVSYNSNGEKLTYPIKDEIQIANNKERMIYFVDNKIQRRHIMSNTMFIELTENFAHLKKYMILLTTNSNLKTEIVSPVFYDYKFKKIDGIWKINYREFNLDSPLDLAMKP